MSLQQVVHDDEVGAFAGYRPNFLSPQESDQMYSEMESQWSNFESGWMLVEGRRVATPRLVAAFGDSDFSFPDLDETLEWTDSLLTARARLERIAGHSFNYALVNWYRDGTDYTGWHSDKMQYHSPGTGVAIISLGAERPLQFRRVEGEQCAEIPLETGSLLLMHGSLQEHFEHAVPADPTIVEPRLSVTFRNIIES